MTSKNVKIAVIGYGNVGHYAVKCIEGETDLELVGIVEQQQFLSELPGELKHVPFVSDIAALGEVDVAVLCIPSRTVVAEAEKYLQQGIRTVDCFDIHGAEMWELRTRLNTVAKDYGGAAVIAAGWDPGADSLIRSVFKIMAPRGLTYTNFGPGMSLGHSVAAKGIEGIADAVSITLPQGGGVHRRMVYVKLLPGVELAEVTRRIKTDAYFANDETQVIALDNLEDARDFGHGVVIEHKGRSGSTHNQLFTYTHKVNNPAVTSQVMIAAARAVMKVAPGAYILPEIPLCAFLNTPLEELVKQC